MFKLLSSMLMYWRLHAKFRLYQNPNKKWCFRHSNKYSKILGAQCFISCRLKKVPDATQSFTDLSYSNLILTDMEMSGPTGARNSWPILYFFTINPTIMRTQLEIHRESRIFFEQHVNLTFLSNEKVLSDYLLSLLDVRRFMGSCLELFS